MFLVTVKALIPYYYKENIREIISTFENIFIKRKLGNQNHKVKPYLVRFLCILKFYAGLYFIAFMQIFFQIFPYLFNGTMIMTVNYWYPFDPFQIGNYPYAWILNSLFTWNASIFFLGFDSLQYGLITVIAMEFDFLKEDIMKICADKEDEKKNALKYWIERHYELMNLCDQLQHIFSTIFFLSLFLSSMIMCFVAFNLLISDNYASYWMYICYLATLSAQILLVCFYGQTLIDSSESIADEIYHFGWEDFEDNDFKKQFILIMARAQKPKTLTALNFADISLPSFTTVNSKSYLV